MAVIKNSDLKKLDSGMYQVLGVRTTGGEKIFLSRLDPNDKYAWSVCNERRVDIGKYKTFSLGQAVGMANDLMSKKTIVLSGDFVDYA